MDLLTILISNNRSFSCPGVCSKNNPILKENLEKNEINTVNKKCKP